MNILIVNISENKTKMFQDIKTVKTFDNFFKLIFNSGKVISLSIIKSNTFHKNTIFTYYK